MLVPLIFGGIQMRDKVYAFYMEMGKYYAKRSKDFDKMSESTILGEILTILLEVWNG